jgi:hypothetical protein
MIIKVAHKINNYNLKKIKEWVLTYNHNLKKLGKKSNL